MKPLFLGWGGVARIPLILDLASLASLLPLKKSIKGLRRTLRTWFVTCHAAVTTRGGRAIDGYTLTPLARGEEISIGKVCIKTDLTRPQPKWWFSKGIPLISGKSRLVKYYNLARLIISTFVSDCK